MLLAAGSVFLSNKYKKINFSSFPQNAMNADAPRSWTEWILIEIRQHSEELHQLPGVDTDRSKIIQGKILPLMPSWEDCDSFGGQVSE